MKKFATLFLLLSISAFGQGFTNVPGGTTPLGTGSALATPNGIKSIAAGTNISFSDDGLTITISSTGGGGGGGHDPLYHTITGADVIAKSFPLGYTPVAPQRVIFDINVGPMQVYNVDYTVSGSNISWSGLWLDGVIATGDIVRISEF